MKLFLKTEDFAVSKETFELFYDETYDMLVTRPQPVVLDKYYQSEDYISHTDANKTLVDKLYQRAKYIGLRSKLALLHKHADSNAHLLDIGAGTGDFLLAAKNAGYYITGVEPNPNARTRAKAKNLPLIETLEGLANEKFEIITLWHVLEHLPDLGQQIKKIIGLLEVDGCLIIAAPNFKSYDAQHYKKYWAAYDVPRHLWHFSSTAIKTLFGQHGYQVVETRPMIFDAFYVSLLSEKYRSGKMGILQFIKAFFIGLASNMGAWRNREYSSLVYVIKKAKS